MNKEGYRDPTPEKEIRHIEQEDKTKRIEAYYKVYRGDKYKIKVNKVSDDATTYKHIDTIVTIQVVGVYPHIVTLRNKKGICESFKWNDFFKRIVRLEK